MLSGINLGGGVKFGKGEILCALAGLLYGVNIAATGTYAKKLDASIYVMIQTWVNVIVSFLVAIVLNSVKIDGNPIEGITFSWNMGDLLFLGGLAVVSSTLCWIIRTNAMKYVNASVVAVMMPFSSVITGVSSVISGKDILSAALVVGGTLVLASVFLSGFSDKNESKQEQKETS